MEEYEVIEAKPVNKSFTERNSDYFSALWTVSLFLGGFYGLYSWVVNLFNAARNGNVFGFIMQLILHGLLIMVYAFIGGAVIFIILVLLTFVPYILYKGLRN